MVSEGGGSCQHNVRHIFQSLKNIYSNKHKLSLPLTCTQVYMSLFTVNTHSLDVGKFNTPLTMSHTRPQDDKDDNENVSASNTRIDWSALTKPFCCILTCYLTLKWLTHQTNRLTGRLMGVWTDRGTSEPIAGSVGCQHITCIHKRLVLLLSLSPGVCLTVTTQLFSFPAALAWQRPSHWQCHCIHMLV